MIKWRWCVGPQVCLISTALQNPILSHWWNKQLSLGDDFTVPLLEKLTNETCVSFQIHALLGQFYSGALLRQLSSNRLACAGMAMAWPLLLGWSLCCWYIILFFNYDADSKISLKLTLAVEILWHCVLTATAWRVHRNWNGRLTRWHFFFFTATTTTPSPIKMQKTI